MAKNMGTGKKGGLRRAVTRTEPCFHRDKNGVRRWGIPLWGSMTEEAYQQKMAEGFDRFVDSQCEGAK